MATSASAARRSGGPNQPLVLLAMCLGQFMIQLDLTIVNVALPSIGHDLHSSVSDLQWPVRSQTAGRMKAGLECSVDELAKLAPLWSGERPLDGDRLAAFETAAFARLNGSDVVTSLKLDGHREQRGLVWVVPVFKLVDHTLGTVGSTDSSGQVTATGEEHASLPLSVAVRILELVSGEVGSTPDGGDGPAYQFDGYRIAHSDKVALTPHG